MKLSRIFMSLVLVGLLCSVAYVSQQTESAAEKMAGAAQRFVDSLNAEQKNRAQFDFDSPERTKWNFVPLQDKNKRPTRKGLPLQDMTADQKKLALAIVDAGTSQTGNRQATAIMTLESILKVLEKKGTNVRDPEWYFFTIFGKPARVGRWGWRVDGHHLSINYTLENNNVVSATPMFFGANPAVIKDGDRKGERILAEVEDLALELVSLLDEKQMVEAMQKKNFGEPQANTAKPNVGTPVGLPAGKMTAQQTAVLMKLLRAYANRRPAAVAEVELVEAQKAGLDQVHFAFTGSIEPGKGRTYRVQGPTFVIEFLNVQADSAGNPNNHIHSSFRRIDGDFGIKGN